MFRVRGSSKEYSTGLAIFALLTAICVGSLYFAHLWQAKPVEQSLATNMATDALFAILTIFGVTRIEASRRKRENKLANKPVYSDI